jgi:hypothetical protein
MAGIIKKCYGCEQAFSERYRNAPNDLVLKRYDHRIYLHLESPRLHSTTPLHLLAHALKELGQLEPNTTKLMFFMNMLLLCSLYIRDQKGFEIEHGLPFMVPNHLV